jgi:gamma-glutamyl hercynylcysteine S-oxide synthase
MRALSAALSTDLAQKARTMGRDGLSVALIDARNRSLLWLAQFEERGLALGAANALAAEPAGMGSIAVVPVHMAGRMAWLQEWWITRNVQRLRGAHSGVDSLRLAPLDARLNEAFGGASSQMLGMADGPSMDEARSYLEATLEQTLDLLSACPADDEALYVYRCALQHEDRLTEAFAAAAQKLGVPPGDAAQGQGPPPPRAARDAIWMPAQRVTVGSAPGGWVPANEQWAHEVDLPESEIDAQAVSWARFVEFAEDGGYDREELWRPEGWLWVQALERRAPRYVEQMRQAVLLHRFGVLQRAPAQQAASHISWFEADAWCRWAGRRLATEVEWEAAAMAGAARGFVWGDVWEWVAGTARAWPHGAALAQSQPPRRVLRGASSWTAARAAHVKQRRFVLAQRDDLFCGFRSCAA